MINPFAQPRCEITASRGPWSSSHFTCNVLVDYNKSHCTAAAAELVTGWSAVGSGTAPCPDAECGGFSGMNSGATALAAGLCGLMCGAGLSGPIWLAQEPSVPAAAKSAEAKGAHGHGHGHGDENAEGKDEKHAHGHDADGNCIGDGHGHGHSHGHGHGHGNGNGNGKKEEPASAAEGVGQESSTEWDTPGLEDRVLRKAETVVQGRTSRFLLVVERCVDSHNHSAIIRTAEALGVQHLWLIDPQMQVEKDGKKEAAFKEGEQHHQFARMANEWTSIREFKTTTDCITAVSLAVVLQTHGFDDPLLYCFSLF